jgi:hypothetical protein
MTNQCAIPTGDEYDAAVAAWKDAHGHHLKPCTDADHAWVAGYARSFVDRRLDELKRNRACTCGPSDIHMECPVHGANARSQAEPSAVSEPMTKDVTLLRDIRKALADGEYISNPIWDDLTKRIDAELAANREVSAFALRAACDMARPSWMEVSDVTNLDLAKQFCREMHYGGADGADAIASFAEWLDKRSAAPRAKFNPLVQCMCGWIGGTSELRPNPMSQGKICPKCERSFWPATL